MARGVMRVPCRDARGLTYQKHKYHGRAEDCARCGQRLGVSAEWKRKQRKPKS